LTEFTETALRHMCRNPRCRSKLGAPVSNPREAFCTRGCHSGFYRKRCLICEGQMERKSERQLICGKRRCRNALQARQSLGRYVASDSVVSPTKTSIKSGIKSRGGGGRAFTVEDAIKYSIGLRAPKRVLDVELANFRFIDPLNSAKEAAAAA
jgi:hypothetical protein